MRLDALITAAREAGASDLHLEAGQAVILRVRGALQSLAETTPAQALVQSTQELAGESRWAEFLERRSLDFADTLGGVRCRINVFQTARGLALAVRLFSSTLPTLERLNLHPDFAELVHPSSGLVIVCGASGSGKSSTLSALVHEINTHQTKHILKIEQPIEHSIRSRKSIIRQREVGRDTPSYAQALTDALREDPDVLVVGEMRTPQTMRLTLNAAETGHLVLTTMHSATPSEALHRVIASFPAEMQDSVRSQLADCLIGVLSQRLRFREELGIRVAECELLRGTTAIKNMIRNGHQHKLGAYLDSQAPDGMWSLRRYREWIANKHDWFTELESEPETPAGTEQRPADLLPPLRTSAPSSDRAASAAPPPPATAPRAESPVDDEQIIRIEPPEQSIDDILSELD